MQELVAWQIWGFHMQFFGFLALTVVFFGVRDPECKWWSRSFQEEKWMQIEDLVHVLHWICQHFLAVFFWFPEPFSVDMDNISSFPSQNLICQGEFFHSLAARAFGEFTTHHSGTGAAGLHPGDATIEKPDENWMKSGCKLFFKTFFFKGKIFSTKTWSFSHGNINPIKQRFSSESSSSERSSSANRSEVDVFHAKSAQNRIRVLLV